MFGRFRLNCPTAAAASAGGEALAKRRLPAPTVPGRLGLFDRSGGGRRDDLDPEDGDTMGALERR